MQQHFIKHCFDPDEISVISFPYILEFMVYFLKLISAIFLEQTKLDYLPPFLREANRPEQFLECQTDRHFFLIGSFISLFLANQLIPKVLLIYSGIVL